MNENDRLIALLEKFHQGSITKEESDELAGIYARAGYENGVLLDEQDEDVQLHIEARYRELLAAAGKRKVRALFRRLAAAAGLMLLIGLGIIAFYINRKSVSHVKELSAVVSYDVKGSGVADSRYLRLRDSSIVILRAGSKLQVDTARFGTASRNVTLKGEAYFDIHHDDKKTFVINVGDVEVTVLGTAFNIRESGDSVSVAVTRGKVKVSKAGKTIAVLTADQQVMYVRQHATQQGIQATEATTWVKEDLQFRGKPFTDIAALLQERYDVHIGFDSEKMKACKISTSGAFSGTENVDEVLAFICTLANATYTKEGNNIKIHGDGCEE